MARILVTAKGGFGDVFPVLAIAHCLMTRGHEVCFAAEPHHAEVCAMLGLRHVPVGGDGAALRGWRTRFGAVLPPPDLAAELAQLLPLAERAELVLGNQLAYAGNLARELAGVPWVFCVASPLAMPARQDPPFWPVLHRLQRHPLGRALPAGTYTGLARAGAHLAMAPLVRLRQRLGLPARGHPRFEGLYSSRLNLLTVSPALLPSRSDGPFPTLVTGFCWLEPEFLQQEGALGPLQAFAAGGAPPVIIVPGGSLRNHPARFFEAPLAACRLLGRRAVVVTAREAPPPAPDLYVTGYMPYAQLFALGAAVVHSGGIGTIGWTMRLGVPSLLLPSDWDQHDNARLAVRARAGIMSAQSRNAPAIALALAQLLADAPAQARLRALAPRIAAENGAAAAADAIELDIF